MSGRGTLCAKPWRISASSGRRELRAAGTGRRAERECDRRGEAQIHRLRDSEEREVNIIYLMLLGLACAPAADEKDAARLPEGPSKEIAGKLCLNCHDSGNFRKARHSSEEWSDAVADMVERGAKGTPAEIEAVVAYLAKNFGPDAPVRINTAPFAEIKVVLGFTVAEVRALLEYREKKGDLKSFEELLKVPGIDPAKAGAQRTRIAF